MSSTSAAAGPVEHMVLLKFKEEACEEEVRACLAHLNSLKSLPTVLYLTAAPLLHTHHHTTTTTTTTNITLNKSFTHLLHSGYSSISHLLDYSTHPSHLTVLNHSLLPICEDLIAIDWVHAAGGSPPPPGSVVRLLVMKPRRGVGEDEKKGVLKAAAAAICGGDVIQVRGGESLCPGRGKGFLLASIVVFNGLEELTRMQGGVEEMMKGWVAEVLESIIDAYYLLPPP